MKIFKYISFVAILFITSCSQRSKSVEYVPFKSSDSDKWGLISVDGTVLCRDVFELCPTAVVNNRFAVQDRNGFWTLCSASPYHKISTRRFRTIGYFFYDKTIAIEGNRLEIINRNGEIVGILNSNIIEVHNFSDGMAMIKNKNRKYGFINDDGNEIVQPQYDFATDYSDGKAVVGYMNGFGNMTYLIIDKDGEEKEKIEKQDIQILNRIQDGLILYRNNGMNHKGAMGFIDLDGNDVIKAGNQSRKFKGMKYGLSVYSTDQGFGAIDKKGKSLVPTVYKEGDIVAEDRLSFKIGGSVGLVDNKGKEICSFIFSAISPFFDNEHAFVKEGNSFGVINKDGKQISNERYSMIVWNQFMDKTEIRSFKKDMNSVSSSIFKNNNLASTFSNSIETVQTLPNTDKYNSSSTPIRSKLNEALLCMSQNANVAAMQKTDPAFRKLILSYVECLRAAYEDKNMNFIEQAFSNDALIIVGKVVKSKSGVVGIQSKKQIEYNVRTKKEYLRKLGKVFHENKRIKLSFSSPIVECHPTKAGFYGVTVKQGYRSDHYSDNGYMFMLWDFRNPRSPQIHVRTWQPTMIDAKHPIPEDEIFNLSNFTLE